MFCLYWLNIRRLVEVGPTYQTTYMNPLHYNPHLPPPHPPPPTPHAPPHPPHPTPPTHPPTHHPPTTPAHLLKTQNSFSIYYGVWFSGYWVATVVWKKWPPTPPISPYITSGNAAQCVENSPEHHLTISILRHSLRWLWLTPPNPTVDCWWKMIYLFGSRRIFPISAAEPMI